MSRKKLVSIPAIGVSLTVMLVFTVAVMGYIPHESKTHGFMVEGTAEKMAEKADIAVKGIVDDSRTYLTYFSVGELVFPKVFTLTDLRVTDVLLGDDGLEGALITVRTVGGTHNQVTTKFEPVPTFERDAQVLVYLDNPVDDLVHGTYYDSQGIQSTFVLRENGKYHEQWDDEALDLEKITEHLGRGG